MKKLLFILCSITTLLLGACSNDPKPTTQEQQNVEQQIARDQVAQDSMEAVIMQQIEAATTDTTASKP